MKKIFTFLFAFIFGMSMLNAQTVKNDGVFSHMYIGINGGANQTTVSNYSNWNNGFVDGLKTLTYNAGLELGKDVTPITGFSLQGSVAPIYHNVANANGSGEWKIERSDVFGNVKFNLMNLFGGYKGYPRRVEIKYVSGIGWNHKFGEDAVNPNDIALQAGLEFDFNLGKNRNWYITFTPMVQANEILRGVNVYPAVKNADLKANVGVAYRFGRGNQSHNFTICPYTRTEDEYDEICTMYDECMNKAAQVDTVVEVKEVIVKEVVVEYKNNPTIVTFQKNSSEITNIEMARLNAFMANNDKDAHIMIVGSADTKTGNEKLNNELSVKRANAVAEILKKNGFTNVEITTKLDAFDDAELSRCAIITCM